jgi:hypothetical protein
MLALASGNAQEDDGGPETWVNEESCANDRSCVGYRADGHRRRRGRRPCRVHHRRLGQHSRPARDLYFRAGNEAAVILDELKTWMGRAQRAIMAVLLLVLGVKLIGDAIGGLGS